MGEYQLTYLDHVWNRACDSFSKAPLQAGDRALRDLLRAHGMICNGGAFHIFDTLTASQIEAAKSGYRFFGFPDVVELLTRAKKLVDENDPDKLGDCEAAFDTEYAQAANDSELEYRFKRHFGANPSDFAPLTPSGS